MPDRNEDTGSPKAKRLRADEDIYLNGDSQSDIEDMLDSAEASEDDYGDDAEFLRLCEEGINYIICFTDFEF